MCIRDRERGNPGSLLLDIHLSLESIGSNPAELPVHPQSSDEAAGIRWEKAETGATGTDGRYRPLLHAPRGRNPQALVIGSKDWKRSKIRILAEDQSQSKQWNQQKPSNTQ